MTLEQVTENLVDIGFVNNGNEATVSLSIKRESDNGTIETPLIKALAKCYTYGEALVVVDDNRINVLSYGVLVATLPLGVIRKISLANDRVLVILNNNSYIWARYRNDVSKD